MLLLLQEIQQLEEELTRKVGAKAAPPCLAGGVRAAAAALSARTRQGLQRCADAACALPAAQMQLARCPLPLH